MLRKKCLFSGERNNTGLFFRCFVQSFWMPLYGPVVWPEELFSFFPGLVWRKLICKSSVFWGQIIIENVWFIWMEDELPPGPVFETVTQQLGNKIPLRLSHHQILVLIEIKHFFTSSPVSVCLMCQNCIVVHLIKTCKTSQPLWPDLHLVAFKNRLPSFCTMQFS